MLIKLDQLDINVLEFLAEQSNKLRNCAIYLLRQAYFTFGEILDNQFDLHAELKTNPHYQIFYSQAAQQICTEVAESFRSYKELLPMWYSGELKNKPKLPKYRKKNGLAGWTYPKQSLSFDIETGLIRLPLGNSFKVEFGMDSLYVQMPHNIKFEHIKELRILPRNRSFYAEFVCAHPDIVKIELDQKRALAIDPGVNNWLSCVPNTGDNSFIVDGFKLKSLTQWYNKQVGIIKEGKPQGFWNDRLAQITERKYRQVKDAVNKAARLIVNYCLKNNIGTVVMGWNQGNKDGIETGKVNNQKIVQTPTARLKKRLGELCSEHGINFVETEESYTSKASFLDGDSVPKYGEKPNGYKPSGTRITRGQYKTASGQIVNADTQAAANILPKVEAQLGLSLVKVCRAVLKKAYTDLSVEYQI
ncbi:RNA-guided endonuclease InsQ/TnpB family protein [Scytonema sp. PCC 10023]|uniref:RNA-guided endonuclease InsQ/TnpB family protein n=1 Tax=Scytonema sp. PCC 10023 TaxID=1680591 RepID=UPI0039C6F424